MPFGSILGAIGSAAIGPLVGRMVGGRNRGGDPAEAAMPYLNQVGPNARAEMNPYIHTGLQAMDPQNQRLYDNLAQYDNVPDYYEHMQNPYQNPPDLYQNTPDLYQGMQNQHEGMPNPYQAGNPMGPAGYEGMGNNPQGFVDEIMRGYTPSAGYRSREQHMMTAANNTAASGGYQGNRADQQTRAQMVRDLMGEDMQQHFQNVIGAQQHGLAGQERGMERGMLGNERYLERLYGSRERAQHERLAGQERASERSLLGRERSLERNLSGNERAQQQQLQGRERALDRRLSGRSDALKAIAEMLAMRQQMGFQGAQGAAGVGASALGAQGSARYMGAAQQAQNRMQNQENMLNASMTGLGGYLSNPNNALSTFFQGSNNLRGNPASTISNAANAGAGVGGRAFLR